MDLWCQCLPRSKMTLRSYNNPSLILNNKENETNWKFHEVWKFPHLANGDDHGCFRIGTGFMVVFYFFMKKMDNC